MLKPVFWYLMFKGNLANQAYFTKRSPLKIPYMVKYWSGKILANACLAIINWRITLLILTLIVFSAYLNYISGTYGTVQLQLHTRIISHACCTRVSTWTDK